ncbi:hypothetical protein PIB30_078122 [Stylosanthes scabra]|uniref:Uncharacterized protein n=1 Tax=Stylosanthes scabra TaxID=79078 RepID=A0ABU6SQW2_9FABA|nr:hypothetical protein [Stylosanthes scabra]
MVRKGTAAANASTSTTTGSTAGNPNQPLMQKEAGQNWTQTHPGCCMVTFGPRSQHEPNVTHSGTRPRSTSAPQGHVWTMPRRGPNMAHPKLTQAPTRFTKPRLDHA